MSLVQKSTLSFRTTGRSSVVASPLVFFFLSLSSLVALGQAKTYDRCELASDLLHKYKLPANQISQCNFLIIITAKKKFNFDYFLKKGFVWFDGNRILIPRLSGR